MLQRSSSVAELIDKKQSLLLLGQRGTGKTWYVSSLLKNLEHTLSIDLLNSNDRARYHQSPARLQQDVKSLLEKKDFLYVFIDEIQKVPDLLNEVHSILESLPGRCLFILTGSSARKLKRADANLMAGRALLVQFHGLSVNEIDFKLHLPKLLQFGTLPRAFTESDTELIIRYLQSYTQTYLQQEIMAEAISRSLDEFSRFLELAAFENARPVNFLKISRQCGLSDKTVKAYFQVLEDTLVVTRIPAWTASIRKQLQKAPKYYIFDNGVLNSLTGELRTELKESSYRYGKLFENLVVNEIIRLNQDISNQHRLYHYRTNTGSEIDLIIQKTLMSVPAAIEIKSSIKPGNRDFDVLNDFSSEYPKAKCFLICNTEREYREGNVKVLPFPDGLTQVFETLE